MDGAIGYNIYRTVFNASRVSEIALYQFVETEMFMDNGTLTFLDESHVPLTPGVLGNWAAVESLNSARAWGSLASAPHPTNRAFLS